MNEKKRLLIAKETAKELFDSLSIDGDFECIMGEEGIDIVLETKDSGIVIGHHGDILESLQLILSLIISRKLDGFFRVSVEVGDYKKNRTGFLESIASRTKDQVLMEKREVPIPSLKSWERRIVHMLLQNDEEVVTESVGIGKERTLVVKPRE